jgi:hypothetical protein
MTSDLSSKRTIQVVKQIVSHFTRMVVRGHGHSPAVGYDLVRERVDADWADSTAVEHHPRGSRNTTTDVPPSRCLRLPHRIASIDVDGRKTRAVRCKQSYCSANQARDMSKARDVSRVGACQHCCVVLQLA